MSKGCQFQKLDSRLTQIACLEENGAYSSDHDSIVRNPRCQYFYYSVPGPPSPRTPASHWAIQLDQYLAQLSEQFDQVEALPSLNTRISISPATSNEE